MRPWLEIFCLCVSTGAVLFGLSSVEAKLDKLTRAMEAPLIYVTPEGRKIVLTPRPDGSGIMDMKELK
jgi:hypothetical protein